MNRAGQMGRAGGNPNADAPTTAKYWLEAADALLASGRDLSGLATGLLLNTAGVPSRAVPGVDYALGSAEQYWAAFAASRLGATPRQLQGKFFDMDEAATQRVTASGVTSGIGPVSTLDGSSVTVTAGDDTAAGSYIVRAAAGFAGIAPVHVANLRTGKWLTVVRLKTTTTPAGGCLIGIRSGAGSIRAGINLGVSATKFVQSQGSLISTVSMDTATHEIANWNDGTNMSFAVDGETPLTAASTVMSTGSDEFGIEVIAAALAAKQTIQVDYWGFWVVRT